MLARWTAFFVWLLVGGSAVFWALRLFPGPPAGTASVPFAGETPSAHIDLRRLLGVAALDTAPAPEGATSTRLRLLGVVAPRSATAAKAGEGVALIEVDGVARTVRVGAAVDGELRLLRIDAQSVSLGHTSQPPSRVLNIHPLAEASTASPQSPTRSGDVWPAAARGLPVRASVPSAIPPVALEAMSPGDAPPSVGQAWQPDGTNEHKR